MAIKEVQSLNDGNPFPLAKLILIARIHFHEIIFIATIIPRGYRLLKGNYAPGKILEV